MALGINDRIPLINGIAYAWGDITATIGGVPVTGITAIEYSDSQELQNNYGAGRYPISRSRGKITCEAKITLTQEELQAIQKVSPNGRIQNLAAFNIIVSYIPDEGGNPIVTDKIMNCQFKKNQRAWKVDDMKQEVELELVTSHILWNN